MQPYTNHTVEGKWKSFFFSVKWVRDQDTGQISLCNTLFSLEHIHTLNLICLGERHWILFSTLVKGQHLSHSD